MKMKVDKKLVNKVARLANLEFDEAGKEKMVSDMDKIISFIDKLEELDTENVQPLVYISEETNVLRADKVGEHYKRRSIKKRSKKRFGLF